MAKRRPAEAPKQKKPAVKKLDRHSNVVVVQRDGISIPLALVQQLFTDTRPDGPNTKAKSYEQQDQDVNDSLEDFAPGQRVWVGVFESQQHGAMLGISRERRKR